MFRRPAKLFAAVPCAVLVYLSLTPAGHHIARKQPKNWETQSQDSEAEAIRGHKVAKIHDHEHAKKHGPEEHRQEQHVGKTRGAEERKGR